MHRKSFVRHSKGKFVYHGAHVTKMETSTPWSFPPEMGDALACSDVWGELPTPRRLPGEALRAALLKPDSRSIEAAVTR